MQSKPNDGRAAVRPREDQPVPACSSWVVRFRRDGKPVCRSFKGKAEAETFLAEAKLRRALASPSP
jgi:hypothetical protein